MCGEYFTGWFDWWGAPHHLKSPAQVAGDVGWMLEHNVSFNLYVAHGGTTFGLWSGANTPPYRPELTSYDYDAPISEAGWPTPKYVALREMMSRHLPPGETLPEIPPSNPVVAIAGLEFAEVAPLFENLPQPMEAERPRTMEALGQGRGLVLYRTMLPAGVGEELRLKEVHDYAVVFVDGRKVGSLDRRLKQAKVALADRAEARAGQPGTTVSLDILVEPLGRVNFGAGLLDRKGITEKAELVGAGRVRELRGWQMFSLPLDAASLASLKWRQGKASGPAYYRTSFRLAETGDTFLEMRAWGKGVVWVNGHNLGRYWNIGPQRTLYCPGPWLKRGSNELIVLEIEPGTGHELQGLTAPVWDQR